MIENVSRETSERLSHYGQELLKWNKKINLISRGTEKDVFKRHIEDSVQVYQAAPRSNSWLDLGSGGGLPGLICAILALADNPMQITTLVESDQRKCAFLRKIKADLSLKCEIRAERIESLPPQGAEIVSARALAPLDRLLAYAHPHLSKAGYCIFPKGEGHKEELKVAQRAWSFDFDMLESTTNKKSAVLVIRNLKRDQ